MFVSKLKAFWKDEEGASLVEYVLLAALIGVAAIVGMRWLGSESNAMLSNVGDIMNDAQ